MAEMAIGRCFHVGDLHDNLGRYPDGVSPGLNRRLRERAGLAFQALEPGHQGGERVVVEARANPTAVDQLAVLELAEEERPESTAGLVRQAVAADDEFVLTGAFALDPE